MRLGRGMLRLHNNLHLSIHHPLLRKCLSRCTNRKPHILSRRACRRYLEIRRHHSYPPILLQRLHSSHQVCGAILSPAHTTLQETSAVGTWKTMALLSWITRFRRSARGRMRSALSSFSSLAVQQQQQQRLKAFFVWRRVLFSTSPTIFNGGLHGAVKAMI